MVDHLAELARAQRAFADGVASSDPEARVPWCGSWRVHDLIEHLARIHHWAAAQARSVAEVPLERETADLTERYLGCAAELLETLRVLDPDQPCLALIPDGTVAFWHRRQLHETLVHLWDLRAAAALDQRGDDSWSALDGVTPLGSDWVPGGELWADTVAEVVEVMQPRQVRLGRSPELPVRLRLVGKDQDRTWTLGHAPDAVAEVTVAGPVWKLALLLWRRIGGDEPGLEILGERADLDRLLALPLTS